MEASARWYQEGRYTASVRWNTRAMELREHSTGHIRPQHPQSVLLLLDLHSAAYPDAEMSCKIPRIHPARLL